MVYFGYFNGKKDSLKPQKVIDKIFIISVDFCRNLWYDIPRR